jgi:hypothetical protein
MQVEEKGTNTDPINITTREDDNPIKVKTYTDVGVQMKETPSVLANKSSTINNTTSMHEENTTNMIRENHFTRNPYRRLKHKSRYLKQSEFQYHLSQEQLIYRPKNIDTNANKSHDISSLWKCNILKKIELGWSDPFSIQHFFSTLRGSYRLVSSTRTEQRMMR